MPLLMYGHEQSIVKGKRGQADFRGAFCGQEVEECRVVALLMKDSATPFPD